MSWKGKSLISTRSLEKNDFSEVLKNAGSVEDALNKKSKLDDLEGRVVAVLFYEPSTRTKLSFESAIERLGGKVLGFDSLEGSSVMKGETLLDTIRMVTQYSDCIVLRHPLEGASKAASLVSSVPIINAGDGSHDHPTQTLLDLYTIQKEFGKLDGLNVGICGDLKYGRTGRPLSIALSNFDNEITFIAPEQLMMDQSTIEFLESKGAKVHETNSLKDSIGKLDVLYMTRIQQERFPNKEEYLKLKGVYVVNKELMSTAKKKMIVMHPLPRVDEITVDVDMDPRARYFEQAGNGLFVRMALLRMIV